LVGLTRDALDSRLRAAGASEDRRVAIFRVLEACDLGRFAPGAQWDGRERVLESAAAAMEGWDPR
jgi:hypothetical protein